MMFRHFLSSLSTAEGLALALVVMVMVLGVFGSMYENRRK
jgi:hypothetical protein